MALISAFCTLMPCMEVTAPPVGWTCCRRSTLTSLKWMRPFTAKPSGSGVTGVQPLPFSVQTLVGATSRLRSALKP
ncbi:hypothetical protein D3C81_2252520 [compost metagenome]